MIQQDMRVDPLLEAQLNCAEQAPQKSHSNLGVRLLRGLFRAVKLCLGQRTNTQIPVDHPMIAWIMEHASLLLNAPVRGTDGVTSWKRVRGPVVGQPLVGLGENVPYTHTSHQKSPP